MFRLLAENILHKSVFHQQTFLPSCILSQKKGLECFPLNENTTATDTLIITCLCRVDSAEAVHQDALT